MEFEHSHETINTWARAFASGDTKAADRLFNHFYPAVFRYMQSRTHNYESAQDLTQEVFFKVARGIKQYDQGRAHFSAWLWQIARNSFTDFLRAKMRKPENNETVMGEEFNLDTAGYTTDADPADADDVARVMKVVSTFPEEDQELFRLKYTADLSYEEISDITGRSTNALSVAMHRIREKIKKAYEF